MINNNSTKTIRLASKSPRRQELLTQLQVEFSLVDIDVDETPYLNESPADYVQRLAIEKAQAGADKAGLALPILGADTIVVVDGRILGKPQDQREGIAMLTLLSQRSHQVMTSIAVVSDKGVVSDLIITDVTFREITESEKLAYWHSGEPCDKAGGYGIQGLGGKFIERINGSYYAVVGLPLMETERLLAKA
jgi:septum formation protein